MRVTGFRALVRGAARARPCVGGTRRWCGAAAAAADYPSAAKQGGKFAAGDGRWEDCANAGDCGTCPQEATCSEVTIVRPAPNGIVGMAIAPGKPVLLMAHAGSPSAECGVGKYVGHRILEVNGTEMKTTEETLDFIRKSSGDIKLRFTADKDWGSTPATHSLPFSDRDFLVSRALDHGISADVFSKASFEKAGDKVLPADVVAVVRELASFQPTQEQELEQEGEDPLATPSENEAVHPGSSHSRGAAAAAQYPAAVGMSVKELKLALEKAGVDTSDCVEKVQLQERYQLARDRGVFDRKKAAVKKGVNSDKRMFELTREEQDAELQTRSIGRLKKDLEELGLATSDCFERESLVKRYRDAITAGLFEEDPSKWPNQMPPLRPGETQLDGWEEKPPNPFGRGCGGGGCGSGGFRGGCH
eukprot:Hpha_TRINITY_DN14058_c0_g2::TRINITY_DN14058_c0_g2_i1::g.44013::m.44013